MFKSKAMAAHDKKEDEAAVEKCKRAAAATDNLLFNHLKSDEDDTVRNFKTFSAPLSFT